jgi:hypothetical protein
MSSNYYLGTTPQEALGNSPRYFYALRRNNDGELFFLRSDQLKDKDQVELNQPGAVEENFEDFEAGIDFFEGIDIDHEIEYLNLLWPQYKWDFRSLLFYVDEQGQLVVRTNQNYTYPEGISSNG